MTLAPERTFSHLDISDWRQFADVSVQFHPRLTVLTGANASGKTTLLNLLGRHFNWASQYLAVPLRSRSQQVSWSVRAGLEDGSIQRIGELSYSDGAVTPLQVGTTNAPTYDVGLPQEQFVPGVFFPSHRPLSPYQSVPSIPTQFSTSQVLLDQYRGEILNRYRGQHSGRSPMFVMKEALLAAAIYGEGNRSVEPNAEAAAIWTGFQVVLQKLLPRTLGFLELKVRSPDLLVRTSTDEFLLDAVSGGLAAIIDMAWQIFLRSRDRSAFTVCIDEPENHLHPSLQREIIPHLLDTFPNLTFIVATHSPFVVTAVADSYVYVLDYEDTKVYSRLLDTVSKAASSDETLRRVLGLETTMPLWVERKLNESLSELPQALGPDDLRHLHDRLVDMGLETEFPAAIMALLPDEPGAPSK